MPTLGLVRLLNLSIGLIIFWATVRKADEASEGGNIDNSFNPQHDESSKKSPEVRGACLRMQCGRADIVPIKAKALGEAGPYNGKAEGVNLALHSVDTGTYE